jgi:nucleoside-diphosphate-sugar epimerase
MRIFITGAEGFIGRHALIRLFADGHRLTAAIRSVQEEKRLQTLGIETVRGNLNEEIDLNVALSGHDAVVHCAAYVSLWGSPAQFQETNIGLTKKLIEAARTTGIKRFIHMSMASVVLNERCALYDAQEQLPLCRSVEMLFAYSKAQAERIVISANTAQFATVILRPAFVWGLGDLVDRQIGPAANQRKFGWFNQGEYLYSSCYIGNLCDAICLALQSSASAEAFFIADDEIMSFRGWMTQRLEAGRYRVPTLSIPRTVAWPLARFTENGWNYLPLKGDPPLVREAVRTTAYPFTLSIEKAKRMLLYKPTYTIAAGMQAIASSNEPSE